MTTAPAFRESVDPPSDGTPWTVLRLLRWSARYLEEKGVEGARLDVEHLLGHALGARRLDLYLQFDRPLTPEELARFKPLLLARSHRQPLQYIVGKAQFRDLELRVDSRVLVPRPETEELVGAIVERVGAWHREGLAALDVGTGSGAIALALAEEGPFERVVATDRSGGALEVARGNAARLERASGVVEFREGDLFAAVKEGERFDVIVSNPPYVSEREYEELPAEVGRWEPREALLAPDGGLGVLLRLVRGAPGVLAAGGLLALEVGAGQAEAVCGAVREVRGLADPEVLPDLSGKDRIVLAAGTAGGDGVAEVPPPVAGSSRGRDSRTIRKG